MAVWARQAAGSPCFRSCSFNEARFVGTGSSVVERKSFDLTVFVPGAGSNRICM